MLVVLSPAKTLDYDTPVKLRKRTFPEFLADSEKLVQKLRRKSAGELRKLMSTSDKIAALNRERYQSWSPDFTRANSRQAILAFMGDVYTGLDVHSLSTADLGYAQTHLRILSGLYGILRPLDLMQPYRLEMGTRLANPRGRDLYEFWNGKLALALNEQAAAVRARYLVNLASNEYFKSIDATRLELEVITPVFKDRSKGQYRVLSFFAKKARGQMARFIIQTRATEPGSLEMFDTDGYTYNAAMSSPGRPTFTRE